MLPKGHVKHGETPAETAVREVHEESGVWARVRKPLTPVNITPPDGRPILVQFYLMEQDSVGWRREREREIAWRPWERAHTDAKHSESKDALTQAKSLLGDES